MAIKGILFDLFGVLFRDRWKEWLKDNETNLKVFANSSPPFTELGLTPEYPKYYDDLIRINTDEKIIDGEPIINDDKFYAILAEASGKTSDSIRAVIHDTTVLNQEVVIAIKKLKDKEYKIGLTTNADKEIAEEFLTTHNLTPLFDAVVTSAEVGKRKPHPAIFNKAAEILGLTFPEMLLIDDSEEIIEGTKLLDIYAIHYHGQTSEELINEIFSQ